MNIPNALPNRFSTSAPSFLSKPPFLPPTQISAPLNQSVILQNIPTSNGSIGSLRVDSNYNPTTSLTKNYQGEFYSSIAGQPCYRQMSVAQLRIQDYYLIRTANVNERQRALLMNHIKLGSFNRQLIDNSNCLQKIPNFALSVNIKAPTLPSQQRFEGIAPEVPPPTIIQVNPQTIKNILDPPKINVFQLYEIPTQNNRLLLPQTQQEHNNFIEKDLNLQQYYCQIRKQLSRRQNTSEIIRSYLDKQLKKMTPQQRVRIHGKRFTDVELVAEYNRVTEMRAVIQLFREEQLTKEKLGNLTETDKKIAGNLWKTFYQIYEQRVKALHGIYYTRITQQFIQGLVRQMENYQFSRLFRQMTSNQLQDTTEEDYKCNDPYTPKGAIKLCQRVEQNHIIKQLAQLKVLQLRLQVFCKEEMLHREEHLYDFVPKYDNIGAIDDLVRQKQPKCIIIKEKIEKIEINKKTPLKSKKLLSQQKSKKKTVDVSCQSKQLFDSCYSDNPESINRSCQLNVIYYVSIIWIDDPSNRQIFQELRGELKFMDCMTMVQIQKQIQLEIFNQHRKLLKNESKFQIVDFRSSNSSSTFILKAHIFQLRINLPKNYRYQGSLKGEQVQNLRIQNNFGRMQWKQTVNVSGIDFTSDVFSIEENIVVCEPDGLNKKCLVTFYSIPETIVELEKKSGRVRAEQKLRANIDKHQGCFLQKLDWKSRSFTIHFDKFIAN